MEKIKEKKYIWNADEVETWIIPFGKVIVLSDSEDPMSAGIVTLNPGAGHERHNHKGAGEILFVIEGEGEQTVEIDGKIVINKQKVKKGDLIQMPPDVFHSTINTGTTPMSLIFIYQFNQSITKESMGVTKVEPPKNKHI